MGYFVIRMCINYSLDLPSESFGGFFRFSLAGEDACLFSGIGGKVDEKKYPNVARWYRNIASYTDEERKQ